MRSVISIGNFDGVHSGHQKLVQQMVQIARQQSLLSVIITYDRHPAYTLNPNARPELLMPVAEKKKRLLSFGIDRVELIHFDEEFARISADEFLHEYLIPTFSPQTIVVGYDSHFGHRREGNPAYLQKHAVQNGYDLVYVEPIMIHDQPVSSSMIRDLLLRGELSKANSLLSYPYTLFGRVIHGTGMGRDLGFPTANLDPEDSHQLVPRSGVYLSHVSLSKGQFFGLTNIGISPTLKHSGKVEVETYILDFDMQIYGCPMQLELLHYLREEKMFDTRESLIRAIDADLSQARKLISAGTF